MSKLEGCFGWGKDMSTDLNLRIMKLLPGRGRRMMVATSVEFRMLIEEATSRKLFPPEPRLLIIGSQHGTGLEAYDESLGRWDVADNFGSDLYLDPTVEHGNGSASGLPGFGADMGRMYAAACGIDLGKGKSKGKLLIVTGTCINT